MITSIDSILALPNDDAELKIQKKYLIRISVLMSLSGFAWGLICLKLGLYIQSLIPFSYVLLTCSNFYIFYLYTKAEYQYTQFFQLFISLLLPFAFQWLMGGFAASGGVMLWAAISLIMALHLTIKKCIFWLVLFLCLTIFTGAYDSHLNKVDGRILMFSNISFVVNISLVSLIVSLFSVGYMRDNKLAFQNAESTDLAKSEFFATVSHELRTPLNGIIGFTDLLSRTELNPKQHQYLNILKSSGYSLLHVINDILDFSKIQSGKIALNLEKTSLPHLIEQVMDMMAVQASAKKLELKLEMQENCPRFILTDPLKLKQVLINLINNAVKFTDKGSITLKVDAYNLEDNYNTTLKFSVIDTGIGIQEENQQKIFEAFFQEDSSSTKKFGGTGLGLTIANNLLSLMNSKIMILSEPGKGSTFYFSISCKSSILQSA